jgi:hypothetical protein
VIPVEDGDRGVGLDEVSGDFARSRGGEAHGLGLVAIELHDESLDVEDDVGDIFHDAGEGHELVIGAGDPDAGDRSALEAREEDATKAVADGGAEAALERLDLEPPVAAVVPVVIGHDAGRKFQASPTNPHGGTLQ